MMTLFDLVAKITLDSSDYQKAVKNAADASKTAQSAVNSLISPIDKVKAAFAAVKHPVETAKQGWESLKSAASVLAHPIDTIKNKIEEQQTAASKNKSVMAGLAKDYDKARQKVEEATAAYKKEAAESGKTSERAIELAKAVDKAEKEAQEAEKAMKEYAESVKKTGKESDEAERKQDKFAEALKKGVAGAAKATGAAVVAAGAAVGKIVYDSVQAFGEFEQLRGGAEKIFSGMDMSVITKDANDAYKTLNMSASEYFAAINQTGAAFKASMGDEKAYETAKIGMKAIADYASGTGKNISELNDKYAMITRSTASYQSIADQFSGILPQTNKEFLAQAQAAGYLSDKYTELTQVPVAEYQEAVTKMLAKGVDQINLTNNAQEESTKTLTGSLAMTKAAWQNFVTGLSDSQADMSQLTANLIESGGYALKNIVPLVKQALSGIGKAVADLAPTLADGITVLVADVTPDLLKAAVQLLKSLGQSLIDNTDSIISAAFEIIDVIVETLSDPNGLILLIDAAFTIIEKLANGLVENLPELIPAVVSIIMQIAEKLMSPDNLIMLVDSAIAILIALADGLISSIDILLEKAPEIIAGFVSAIVQAAPRLFDASLAIIGKLGEGIRNSLRLVWDVGKNIVSGIWQGITNSLDWIKGKIKGWVGNVMSFIKGLFGIRSPSKWAENIIGKNLVLGMAEGILENEDAVSDALNDLTNGVSADAILNMGASIPTMSDGTITEDYLISDDRNADGTMSQILSLLNYYLPTMASMKVMLDSGALVGELAPGMDAALGRRSVYAARGIT